MVIQQEGTAVVLGALHRILHHPIIQPIHEGATQPTTIRRVLPHAILRPADPVIILEASPDPAAVAVLVRIQEAAAVAVLPVIQEAAVEDDKP